MKWIVFVLKVIGEFICWCAHVINPATGFEYRPKFFKDRPRVVPPTTPPPAIPEQQRREQPPNGYFPVEPRKW